MAAKKNIVDDYIAERPAEQQTLLKKLQALISQTVPDATPAIKWGVPVYQRNGKNICALAAFKEHVGINFFASPDVLADPKKRLEGGGKTSRMLKVRAAKDIDAASIKRWLKAAAGV